MMKKIIFIVGLLLIGKCLLAQTEYKVTNVDLGTGVDIWGIALTNDGEIFFSGKHSQRDAEGNELTRLYMLKPGSKTPVMLFEKESKNFPHMGAPYVTPDGKELYFTVSSKTGVVLSREVFKAPKMVYPLQIAMSKRNIDGSWGAIEMFEHNIEKYSSGDPWLSNDGRYLYFASNRAGGKGGLDLWRSKRNTVGGWAEPENLQEINTEADERSPRFDSRSNFYFASNNSALGGLDIFSCALLDDGHFAPAVRMATPINSRADDFAIVFTSENSGYFTSNRLGKDAVYQFEKISNDVAVKFKVIDAHTGLAIADAQAYFVSEQAFDSKLLYSDNKGYMEAKIHPNASYTLIIYKDNYIPNMIANELSQYYHNRTIAMEPIAERWSPAEECPPTTEINRPVNMTGINFDFDKWNINAEAAQVLDRLLAFMKAEPKAEIEVSAHTDCRGSHEYNMLLSQRRANAVKKYLTDRGIASKRIKAVGYGKTKLINRCDCKTTYCTDAEHEFNRRAEFVVLTK